MNKGETNIPDTWKWVSIGDIAVTSSGGTPDRQNSNYFKGTIPWVKSGELNYNIITGTEEYITDEALAFSSAKIFPKGSLLIALYGNTVGRMAFLGVDASTNQAVASITPFLVNPKYLYYYLFSSKEELLNKREGSAQPNISQKVLNEFTFPLTFIEEQNRIVDKIEEIFSELDKIISQLTESLNKSDYLKAKLLDRHIINDAKYVKLVDLVDSINYGYTAKSSKIKKENSLHYLRITDIQNGKIDWNKVPFCEITEKDDISKFKLQEDDILFARSGNTVGKSILINNVQDSLFASYLIRIRCTKTVLSPKFLYYFMQTNFYWKQINEGTTGIGQPNFNGTKLANLMVPSLDILTQNNIVEFIEVNFDEIEKLKNEIENNIIKTRLLKSKILNDAFSGKLIPQNFQGSIDDLLLRIKEAKDSHTKGTLEKNRSKSKLKKKEVDLYEIISSNYKNRPFSYSEIFTLTKLPKNKLRTKFQELEQKKLIINYFDEKSETIKYTLV